MRKLLVLLVLVGLVASAGCIQRGGGGIILSFGNQTYTVPLNQSSSGNNTSTTTTPAAPAKYRYSRLVDVGETLYIKELNYTIRPDYDVQKSKFFFVTPDKVYWEPMNVTIAEGVQVIGQNYFVGMQVQTANITIISDRKLTVEVMSDNGTEAK